MSAGVCEDEELPHSGLGELGRAQVRASPAVLSPGGPTTHYSAFPKLFETGPPCPLLLPCEASRRKDTGN